MVVVACLGVSGGCDSFDYSVDLYGGGSERLAIPVRSRSTISAATESHARRRSFCADTRSFGDAVSHTWERRGECLGLDLIFFGLSGLGLMCNLLDGPFMGLFCNMYVSFIYNISDGKKNKKYYCTYKNIIKN